MKHPLTKEAFADWCGRQPPDMEYAAWDYQDCAIAQYEKYLGVPLFTLQVNQDVGGISELNHIACARPQTFGALAERLRA